MNIMACINNKRRSISITIFTLIILFISATSTARDLVSSDSGTMASSYIFLPTFKPSLISLTETCEQTYGFVPCTTNGLGNLFLIVAYGYLMFSGAVHLSNGAELLLEVVGPNLSGLVAGLVLPLLGTLPHATLILVSGLSGSTTTAQDQVSIGMGMLAGSTIMLLTVIWGACVLVGKCDLDHEKSIAKDGIDTKIFNLRDSGVSTDVWTRYAAWSIIISVLPFLIVQLHQIPNLSSGKNLLVLISLIISLLMLIFYIVYQVRQPEIQKKRLEYVKHKRAMIGFLQYLQGHTIGKYLNSDGTTNQGVLHELFTAIDLDSDGELSHAEIGAFISGRMGMNGNENDRDIVKNIMKEFDTEKQDGKIDQNEFASGIQKLLKIVSGNDPIHEADNPNRVNESHKKAEIEHFLLGEKVVEEVEISMRTVFKAIFFIVFGIIITIVFADPLVDVVDNFSVATNIPSFFVSFIALPLITNSKGAVSVISFASKKSMSSASLAFSELYGEVAMNNVLGISVLLALVYARGLTWDFSSEVLVVFLVCLVMGVLTCRRTTFRLWTSIMAFLLCPFSLLLVYCLNNSFGWS